MGRAAAPVDLGRVRQALLAVAQPGLAAVLALGGLPSLRVSLVGLVAAAAGFLAVFSLNDLLDRRVDDVALRAGAGKTARRGTGRAGRAARRGGSSRRRTVARGELRPRFSALLVVSLAALSALLALSLTPLCLLLYGGAVALDVVYCALRSVTAWKTVVSGAMVGLGGLAGWAAVAPLSLRALTVFGFLALWQIGGRDIARGLAGIDGDRRRGVTTVATVYGPPAAARAACVVGFAALAATVTLPMTGALLNDIALGAGVFIVAWPGAKLWHEPTSAEAAAYVAQVNLYPAAVLLVALVPAAAGRL